MNTKCIHPKHIGFDIDGVVANTSEAFIRLAREKYGISDINHDDITEFEVTRCLPHDPAIIEEIFELLLQDPLACDLQPMPQAVSVLTKLSQQAPLTFITARPQKTPIAHWLREMLGEEVYSNSHLIAMGDHDGKYTHIRKRGLRYFVDDRVETCLALHNRGIIPIVYTQPWNKDRHQLKRVENWLGIQRLCA